MPDTTSRMFFVKTSNGNRRFWQHHVITDRMEAHVCCLPEIATILTRKLVLGVLCRNRWHFLHGRLHIQPQVHLRGRVEFIPFQRLHRLLALVGVNPASGLVAPDEGRPNARKDILHLLVRLQINSHGTEDVIVVSPSKDKLKPMGIAPFRMVQDTPVLVVK